MVLCRRWTLAYHVRGGEEEELKHMPEHVRPQWHANNCWSLVKDQVTNSGTIKDQVTNSGTISNSVTKSNSGTS